MTNLLSELNLVPLVDRRKQSRLILLSKGVFGQAHIPIDRLRHPIRKTRQMHDLHFCNLYARSNCYKFSFLPQAVKDWNSLPESVISAAVTNKDPASIITRFLNKV